MGAMAPRVIAVPDSPQWEPNVPEAVLTTDDFGVTRLVLAAHFDDPDQSRVVIEWTGTWSASMGYPNDEALHEHPLYGHGLDRLLWMGEVLDGQPGTHRRFILPLKESTVEVVASDWRTSRQPRRPLLTIGYWGNDQHPDYPDPRTLIDESWDEAERFDVAHYLERQPVARAFMGYSPCRICGRNNGDLELTDGTFIWPDGLAHYVRDHHVRLPAAFVRHVEQQSARWDYATGSTDWWLAQFGTPPDGTARPEPADLAGRELVLGQLALLRRELADAPEGFENDTLDAFLDAYGALLGSIEHAYRNNGRPVPESPWQIVADALDGARYYE